MSAIVSSLTVPRFFSTPLLLAVSSVRGDLLEWHTILKGDTLQQYGLAGKLYRFGWSDF